MVRVAGLTRAVLLGLLAMAALGACSGGRDPQVDNPPAVPPGLAMLGVGSSAKLALRLYPVPGASSHWCVYREWATEVLRVLSSCGLPRQTEVAIPGTASGELLPRAVAEYGDQLWLLVYDAANTVPSGRGTGPTVDGLDVYLIDKAQPASAVRMAVRVQLGGLDNLVYAKAGVDGLVACAISRCFSISASGQLDEWSAAGLASYEFVDVVVGERRAAAIVRLVDDHATGRIDASAFHYAVARMRPEGVTTERVVPSCLPFALRLDASGETWSCARSAADLGQLLSLEIARMPFGGLMDFGASNSEGRIAWGQAYYLNGLMHFAASTGSSEMRYEDIDALRDRLRSEANLLAMGVLEGNRAYESRRYSLHRTPLTFALHLGRIARILRTALDTGHGSAEVQRALDAVDARLKSLDGVVEELAIVNFAGEAHATLRYAQGVDFWCDGANVPYNYVSGYVDGLLAGSSPPIGIVQRAASLMRPIQVLEGTDSVGEWKYWWAWGSEGWTAADGVSANTLEYPGNPGLAHITYRSMDALALLRLIAVQPDAVKPGTKENIMSLVSTGGVLPWVNEGLVGLSSEAGFTKGASYRFARSAAPWELQSQVWVLEQLAREWVAGSP